MFCLVSFPFPTQLLPFSFILFFQFHFCLLTFLFCSVWFPFYSPLNSFLALLYSSFNFIFVS
jgi:hypothetical protein